MNHGAKINLQPVETELCSDGSDSMVLNEMLGSGKRQKPVRRCFRSASYTDIVIKLCAIKAYDGARRVLDPAGAPVMGSDISLLLDEALSPRRTLVGMTEFVEALARARVEPNSILNDNIRLALEKKMDARRASQRHRNADEINNEADKSQPPERRVGRPKTQLPRAEIRLERLDLDKYRHMFTNRSKK